jgi:hypothetical protein
MLAALLACSTASLQAHEWPSPKPPAPLAAAGWSGMVWAGPEAGAPAAPSARHCAHAPQSFAFSAGPPWDAPQQIGLSRRDGPALRERESGAVGASAAPASTSARAAAPVAPSALTAPAAMADSLRPLAKAEARKAPAPAVTAAQALPPTHPAQEPVSAGVVDDNADFGEYLAYRERRAHLPVRARDVSERYGLAVHDARGRPVPDAVVTVFAGQDALPLWARTDAAGRAWLRACSKCRYATAGAARAAAHSCSAARSTHCKSRSATPGATRPNRNSISPS